MPSNLTVLEIKRDDCLSKNGFFLGGKMDFKKALLAMGAMIFAFQSNAKDIDNIEYVPNELIVKFKEGSFQTMGVLNSLQAQPVTTFRASGAMLVRFPKVVDVKQMMHAMTMNSEIEYVELNQVYHLNAMPNDPEFDKLYGLHNEGKTGGALDADIDGPEAWEVTRGSRDILVGVIDTGVDYTHPDLVDNIWSNPGETGVDADGNDKATNGIDDDGNGYIDDHRGWDFFNDDNDPMDGHSHGTHVSGTIGAVGNNGIGVAGVNWEVSIVGLKIFSDAGRTTADAIVRAIEYGTTLGIDMSNNSWGGGGFSQPIKDAISEANDAGIFFIAAAGNSRNNNDTRAYYPANYELDNIITVAATDHNDRLASFSSYGSQTVEIAAPGVNVYSTTPGGRYGNMSGTSMATPHVTGLMALVKSQYPDADMMALRDRVVNTGDRIDALSNRVMSGARINALNSLEDDNVPPNAPANLSVDDSGIRSVNLSWDVAGDDGAEGRAARYDVRISDRPMTDDNFGEATAVAANTEQKSETRVAGTISGLPLNYEGYVAVRAVDNLGNVGPVSESLPIRTREVQVMFENAGDSLNGFTADAPWGVQQVGENYVLTDSPEGNYGESADTSLTSGAFNNIGGYFAIAFDHSHKLENNYDFGNLEISVDGGEWQQIERYTNNQEMTSVFHDLTDRVRDAQQFQIRFRLTSDGSAQRDGWMIDNVSIIHSPASFQ